MRLREFIIFWSSEAAFHMVWVQAEDMNAYPSASNIEDCRWHHAETPPIAPSDSQLGNTQVRERYFNPCFHRVNDHLTDTNEDTIAGFFVLKY
jgi:hypothetical protein